MGQAQERRVRAPHTPLYGSRAGTPYASRPQPDQIFEIAIRFRRNRPDRGRFRMRVISGHKGMAVRKPVTEQYLRVITCRPVRTSKIIAQSIVHRGVRKWFRRWSPTHRVFSTR